MSTPTSAVIGILMTRMLLSPINALEVGKKLSEVLVLVYLYIQGLAWGYLPCKCVNYSLLFLRSCQKRIPKHNKFYLKTDNSDKKSCILNGILQIALPPEAIKK